MSLFFCPLTGVLQTCITVRSSRLAHLKGVVNLFSVFSNSEEWVQRVLWYYPLVLYPYGFNLAFEYGEPGLCALYFCRFQVKPIWVIFRYVLVLHLRGFKMSECIILQLVLWYTLVDYFHNAHFYDFNPPPKVLFCQYSIVDCFSHHISDDLFSVNVIFFYLLAVYNLINTWES